MLIKKSLKLIAIFCMFLSSISQANELVVGGKGYTEQLLIAEMTTQLLEKAGYSIKQTTGMGGSLLRKAMVNGQIDVYWEYTGTSLITYNKVKERLSPEDTYERVKTLDAKKGIVWLTPSKANNTYALARRKGDHTDLNSISELAATYKSGTELKMGVSAEFTKRADGLIGLQKTYGFRMKRKNVVPMQTGLVYDALHNGEVDIAMIFATDGRISAFGFEVLEDDLQFFPSYALTPTIRKEVLDANPELSGLLNELSGKLDDKTMQRLNGEVAVNNKSIREVSSSFLKEVKLI
ncbi:glycine betaine ABC transporter substrate-binding protein [Amphritea opalescens]|uniref:Glycine betaine ABC transporter substrate-binding protein n=1 Tax=Amphritea opalescens TaxID=2490544 RepID=A0A430KUZ7_9GAMM|nr:glycine betaine ABC transporter substrate-binding protein [Amphritea opalescens]RTE67310.1 glycine betaine ABC transporter substrate-binding protein [Amphritea opalescens]